MKLFAALLLIGVTSAPAFAGGPRHGGWVRERECYRREYRERYVPGTRWSSGYVQRYYKKVRIVCEGPRFIPQVSPDIRYEEEHPNVGRHDDNSCIEGSILGGIAGGGLGAALSRDAGRLWAIPLGIVGGAVAGCQVDGG